MSQQKTLFTRNIRSDCIETRRKFKLESELVTLQEEFHRQIASALHDSTCQLLVAASLGVMQVRNALADPLKAERHCEQVDLSINRALTELRSLTYLLYPQSLFEDGLKRTIERYAEGFTLRTALPVEFLISPVVDSLSRESQHSLMRIVQEALTNVYRHAKATRVNLTIEVGQSKLQLEVRDDGQGMAAAGNGVCRLRKPALGTGLRIMQARVEEMEGRLEILSGPAAVRQGTTLRATFPYDFAIEHKGRRYAIKKGASDG